MKVPSVCYSARASSPLPGFLVFFLTCYVCSMESASGSAPHVFVEDYQDGGIRVVCRSAGWYPEPKVVWRDLNGQAFPSASQTNSREANGLYRTETSAVIMENSNRNLSCMVRNTRLSQEKESTLFYISDPFFPKVNPWMASLGVTLVVLLGSFALSVYLFKIKEKYAAELKKLTAELSWKTSLFPIEEVKLTLDPDTAHPELVLSEDGKRVRWEDTLRQLPNTPERFNARTCVLGREGFISGRHYWEVEVGDGPYWAVGVARESVSRKGLVNLSPEVGIWAVGKWEYKFQALTAPETLLPLSPPSRIRVCLDCDQGQVTFIDAGTEAPIFTFPPGSLPGERIRPWIWVCWDRKTWLRLSP